MSVHTGAGIKLSIGTTAANHLTDAYVLVGELTTIPEFGKSFTDVTHNPLASRKTIHKKGSFDFGSVALVFGCDKTDAGQQDMQDACDDTSDTDYNIKIEMNDAPTTGSAPTPTIVYLKAQVMSFTTNINQINNITTGTATIGINDVIEVPAAAGA